MPLIQVILVTIMLILLTVGMHYEFLHQWPRIESFISKRARGRILRLVLTLIVLHSLEMVVFGFGYWFLRDLGQLTFLNGETALTISDYIYYSAAVYTTVGFGDIVPHGPMRFLTGLEGLLGLLLITWSASFTFLEMQRFWNR